VPFHSIAASRVAIASPPAAARAGAAPASPPSIATSAASTDARSGRADPTGGIAPACS
jgi:hypothetical protein